MRFRSSLGGCGRGGRLRPSLAAVVAVSLLAAPGARASCSQLALRDDFDGVAFDTTTWFVPTGDASFYGRTQIRPPELPPAPSGGVLRLELHTHNPTSNPPGTSFWGSEVETFQRFDREGGLCLRVRARLVPPVSGGLVAGLFSFVFPSEPDVRDEIDFELLGNDVRDGLERVLTNVFHDEGFASPGTPVFAAQAGLDLTEFHDYEFRWLTDRVLWFVDGVLVREEQGVVPDDPMPVHLNLWAPDPNFPVAYDAALQPTADPEQDQVWYAEIDFVEVSRLPLVPASPLVSRLLLAVLLVTAATALFQGKRAFLR